MLPYGQYNIFITSCCLVLFVLFILPGLIAMAFVYWTLALIAILAAVVRVFVGLFLVVVIGL